MSDAPSPAPAAILRPPRPRPCCRRCWSGSPRSPRRKTPPPPAVLPGVRGGPAEPPGEEFWPAKQKSAPPRRAYRLDVRHFMATLGITTADALRQADHRAVIAWERTMRETERAAPSTIRR